MYVWHILLIMFELFSNANTRDIYIYMPIKNMFCYFNGFFINKEWKPKLVKCFLFE
jgi:hypothetical protein